METNKAVSAVPAQPKTADPVKSMAAPDTETNDKKGKGPLDGISDDKVSDWDDNNEDDKKESRKKTTTDEDYEDDNWDIMDQDL